MYFDILKQNFAAVLISSQNSVAANEINFLGFR